MRKLLAILILSSMFSGFARADVIIPYPIRLERGGGVVVGNGGYSIQCDPSQPYRSYDLLMAESYLSSVYQLRPEVTCENSLKIIRAFITAKMPTYTASFDEYVAEIFNTDPSKTYIWNRTFPDYVEGRFLPVEERFSDHQEACPGDRDTADINLMQTVLRHSHKISGQLKISLFYDVITFSGLPELDRSFLLVHEWLWNFTDDLNVNRAFDYMLHSDWIETASSQEVAEKLKEIGFKNPPIKSWNGETPIR